MAQETQPQPFSLAGSLDDAGNIGHYERLVVAVGHDAQARFECRKGIIGYLGTGG